jgi:hypothetical protein
MVLGTKLGNSLNKEVRRKAGNEHFLWLLMQKQSKKYFMNQKERAGDCH